MVTLTVCGNDLLGAYGDTTGARKVVHTVIVRVGQALTRIARLMRLPDHAAVIGTVYDPSDGSGDAARLGLRPGPRSSTFLPSSTTGCARSPRNTKPG